MSTNRKTKDHAHNTHRFFSFPKKLWKTQKPQMRFNIDKINLTAFLADNHLLLVVFSASLQYHSWVSGCWVILLKYCTYVQFWGACTFLFFCYCILLLHYNSNNQQTHTFWCIINDSYKTYIHPNIHKIPSSALGYWNWWYYYFYYIKLLSFTAEYLLIYC